jgi:hypothetical protein
MSTEYEESGLSIAKPHIGVVDGSLFNPRTPEIFSPLKMRQDKYVSN